VVVVSVAELVATEAGGLQSAGLAIFRAVRLLRLLRSVFVFVSSIAVLLQCLFCLLCLIFLSAVFLMHLNFVCCWLRVDVLLPLAAARVSLKAHLLTV
jgi:hypothetical protein